MTAREDRPSTTTLEQLAGVLAARPDMSIDEAERLVKICETFDAYLEQRLVEVHAAEVSGALVAGTARFGQAALVMALAGLGELAQTIIEDAIGIIDVVDSGDAAGLDEIHRQYADRPSA